ncbi:hypothetical protein ACRFCX_25785, partial [Klebsiella pneumoniae]
MTEHVEKYTNKAIEIIADYIQRTNKKNEQLQEAKVRLDKKIALFADDEKSLYINLCNCLILICSIQHHRQVTLW